MVTWCENDPMIFMNTRKNVSVVRFAREHVQQVTASTFYVHTKTAVTSSKKFQLQKGCCKSNVTIDKTN